MEQSVLFLFLFISLVHLHVDSAYSSTKSCNGEFKGQILTLLSLNTKLTLKHVFLQFTKSKNSFISMKIIFKTF